jgi:hypothetical protein
MKTETKKVIDGDTMKCLETFDEDETKTVVKKYTDIGKWDDVSIDSDGDIILYAEL